MSNPSPLDASRTPSSPVRDDAPSAETGRPARLAAIRAMIDDGSYETAERLDAAVTRMLCDVFE